MNERKLTVTQSLIIINIVVFLVGMVVQKPGMLGLSLPGLDVKTSVFEIFFCYSWFTCFQQAELWRLITYQFVHANVAHIVFNMWALYFFGPVVEYVLGGKRFLIFYLVCGIAGALFSSLLAGMGLYSSLGDDPLIVAQLNAIVHHVGYEGTVASWQMMPMVGASAAIYGIMVATAFMAPDARISLLFPPVTMTLRTFAIVVFAIACSAIFFDWTNAGGEAGHLGGIIMGIILMLIRRFQMQHAARNRSGGGGEIY